jgi:photosystem II stability/assembly factor-like uncharacterized protein
MTLLVDYDNPNRFVLASYSQLYFTSNGGASYTQLMTPSAYLAGTFFDGSNIYIATDKGILVSGDNGATFTLSYTPGTGKTIPSAEGIVSFAGAKSGGTTRFFVVTTDGSQIYPGIEGGLCYSFKGVYTMDVGQSDWTKVNGIPAGTYPGFVAMTKNDIRTVYLGGGSSASAPSVLKSTNAGATWTSVFKTTNNLNIQSGWQGYNGDISGWGFGELAFGLAVAPFDANKVMITDMGGAYLTTDGGTTWKAVYENPADLNAAGQATPKGKAYRSNGLDPTTVWGLTWADPNNVFACFTDIRGVRSTDGGNSWSFNYTGDTFNTMYSAVVQPGTGTLFAAVSNTHDIYEAEAYERDSHIDAGNGQVLYSTNKGASWSTLHDFGHPVVWTTLDPNNANRMFVSVANYGASAGGVYVSNNINLGTSSTWTKLAAPPRTEGHPFNIVVLNDGTLLCTYAGRWTSSGIFSASSGVFVGAYDAATSTVVWADRTDSAMQYFSHDITVDPSDPTQNTWYVGVWFTTSGVYWPEGGLYKTADRGQHWSLVPGSNAMGKVSQVAFNPLNNNEMYITTGNKGLWFTSNAHAASPTFTQAANYPFYEPVRVIFNPYNPREVWITSFGNGLRVGFDSSGLLGGDANMDGKVSFADYLLLEANFGKSSPAPAPLAAAAPVAASLSTNAAGPLALPAASQDEVGRFMTSNWQPMQLQNIAKTTTKPSMKKTDLLSMSSFRKLRASEVLAVNLLKASII